MADSNIEEEIDRTFASIDNTFDSFAKAEEEGPTANSETTTEKAV